MQLVRHCLEKDREKRFHSADDLAFHLEALRTPSGSLLSTRPQEAKLPKRLLWVLVPLALAAVAALAIRTSAESHRTVPVPPSIRRLTFRNGMVTAARFAPDARTVFFSASWNGERERLYSTTTTNPDYNPVGVNDARLAAISPSGEIALLLHPRTGRAGLSSVAGTLAVLPGVGGAPREIAEDVTGADWAPDGARMALTRQVPGGYQLEFPVGTVVHESQAPLLHPRVSPDGRTLVFVERERPEDAKGGLVLLEPGKQKRVLLRGWEELTDVAWTPRGDELWFSGLRAGVLEHPSLWAVSLKGDVRLLHPATSDLILEDVGRDGRALAREGQSSGDVGALKVASGKVEAHLAWFDAPRVVGISADGSALLVDESGDAATTFGVTSGGGPSWAFLQQTSGAPAIRLGPGAPRALSADGRTALVFDNAEPGRIWLLPTGVGLRRHVDFAGLSFVPWAECVPARCTEGGRAGGGRRRHPRAPGGLPVWSEPRAHPAHPPMGAGLARRAIPRGRSGRRQADGVPDGSRVGRASAGGSRRGGSAHRVDRPRTAGLTGPAAWAYLPDRPSGSSASIRIPARARC